MKKSILLLAVAVLAVSACKKDKDDPPSVSSPISVCSTIPFSIDVPHLQSGSMAMVPIQNFSLNKGDTLLIKTRHYAPDPNPYDWYYVDVCKDPKQIPGCYVVSGSQVTVYNQEPVFSDFNVSGNKIECP